MRRLVWTCMVAVSCAGAARAPRPELPADPPALLRVVREREDHVATLRASFTASIRTEAGERTVDGVLLVDKPELFRLRLMLPFGMSVFDYLNAGDAVHVVSPFDDDQLRSLPLSAGDLRQAFLRGPYAFPGDCVPETVDAVSVDVVCRNGAGEALRRIRVERATARIREETTYQDGLPATRFAFSGHEQDDADLPHRISLDYVQRPMALDIRVRRYEINPPLAPELFLPVP